MKPIAFALSLTFGALTLTLASSARADDEKIVVVSNSQNELTLAQRRLLNYV